MALLAQLVGAVFDRELPSSRLGRAAALAAVAVLLAVHLALAPVMTHVMLDVQRDWFDALVMLHSLFDMPQSMRHWLLVKGAFNAYVAR